MLTGSGGGGEARRAGGGSASTSSTKPPRATAPPRIPITLEHALGLPSKRKLWSKVSPTSPLFEPDPKSNRKSTTTRGKRGQVRQDKSFELAFRDCDHINSALSDETDVSAARVLAPPDGESFCYIGQYPRYEGFWLSAGEAKKLFAQNRANRQVVHPFLVGRELLEEWGGCDRWVIDFQTAPLLKAKAWKGPFAVLEKKVLPYVQAMAGAEHKKTGLDKGQEQTWLNTWWQLFRPRPQLIAKITQLSRYVVCSRHTKRPIFVFVDPAIRPGDALVCFTFADDYSFGILQSDAHWQWFIAKCSKLTERFRYTPESVFDTFPWPQSPTKKQIRAVAAAGREIRRIRAAALPTMTGGLRALYRTLELPGKNPLRDAHAALDAATLEAYGFSAAKDLLAQLLSLNLSVAAAIDKGEAVTAPGVSPAYGDADDLVTDDCIKP